jgi:hypothetical protein
MGVQWTDPNANAWAGKYGDKYQRADAGLLALTGNAHWRDGSAMTATGLAALKSATANRVPAIALTRDMDLSRYGLIADHAYTVLAVNGTSVTLRNPWGTDGVRPQGANDGVITISWSTFTTVMQGFCIS